VNGETQAMAMAALRAVGPALVGADCRRWRALAHELRPALLATPSALCAMETAVLDALCRHGRISLWSFFGGAEAELESDITLPTGSAEAAFAAAARAVALGFRTLKVKVGGSDPALDLDRLAAIGRGAPRARLILDANASLAPEQALWLLARARELPVDVVLFEQPTAPGDLAGLAAVRQGGGVPVAADESARTLQDVMLLAERRAADVVNLKLMKSGLAEALDMAFAARALGLGLMIGGMVESKLAMSTSACFAAGLGGFSHVDLDTPWFMRDAPTSGGYTERGPRLSLSELDSGHGVTVEPR
jgi:L-alanine-DL-glutamate epimerase-like enolase superfamily enzyme